MKSIYEKISNELGLSIINIDWINSSGIITEYCDSLWPDNPEYPTAQDLKVECELCFPSFDLRFEPDLLNGVSQWFSRYHYSEIIDENLFSIFRKIPISIIALRDETRKSIIGSIIYHQSEYRSVSIDLIKEFQEYFTLSAVTEYIDFTGLSGLLKFLGSSYTGGFLSNIIQNIYDRISFVKLSDIPDVSRAEFELIVSNTLKEFFNFLELKGSEDTKIDRVLIQGSEEFSISFWINNKKYINPTSESIRRSLWNMSLSELEYMVTEPFISDYYTFFYITPPKMRYKLACRLLSCYPDMPKDCIDTIRLFKNRFMTL